MDYETQKHRLLEAPDISYWLKKAIAELERRDPLDATNDARLLAELMMLRETEILHEAIVYFQWIHMKGWACNNSFTHIFAAGCLQIALSGTALALGYSLSSMYRILIVCLQINSQFPIHCKSALGLS